MLTGGSVICQIRYCSC